MKQITLSSLVIFATRFKRLKPHQMNLNVKAFLPLFIIVLIVGLRANAQEYVWAKKAGSRILSMMDANSNSFIVGNFFDFVTFEDLTVTDSVNHVGDIFFGKYSPSGALEYMHTTSGTGDADIISSDLDSQGNLFILAKFEGDITIGGVSMSSDIGIYSYVVAKVDNDGQTIWAKRFLNNFSSGQYSIELSKIACDRENNVLVTGRAYNYTIDSITVSAPGSNLFLAKLDKQDGAAIWAKKVFAPVAQVSMLSLAFDPNDNIYLSGNFSSDFTFEGGTTVVKTPNAIPDAYLCKLDKNGVFKWISQSPGNVYVSLVGLNFSGDDHLTYVFSDHINHYDTTGQLLSQNNSTSTNYEFANIAKDKNSDYVFTLFKDQFAYGGAVVDGSDSNKNGLIIKLDPSTGALLWHTNPTEFTYSNYLSSNQKGLLQFSGMGESAILHLGNHQLLRPVVLNSAYLHDWGFNAMIIDSFFNTGSNIVHGKIFNDTVNDCQWNNEPGLSGFTVMAEPGPYFAISDSLGDYELKMDTGNYFISTLIPNNHTFIDTTSCLSDSIPVYFANQSSPMVEQNFGEKYQHCTLLKLDAANVNIYMGQNNTQYTLTICNEGQDTVVNPILSLKYPGNVSFPILSNPSFSGYSTLDSTLTIPLENLSPQSCISVAVMDSIVLENISSNWGYKYQVSITPKNSCYLSDSVYSQKDFILSIQLPVKIGEIAYQQKPIIFPNPSDGTIFIKGMSQDFEVNVYDITGRKVACQININKAVATIDLGSAPNGIYIVALKNQKQNFNYKIAKNAKNY